jgi:hypothetical protein
MADVTNWFRHDVNAVSDKGLQGVIRRFGMEGVGIYWCLVETLYKEEGYLSFDDIEDLAFSFHVTARQIEDIVKNSGLFKFDSKCFWSSRILNELQRVEDISKIKTKAVRTRWDKARAESGEQQPDAENPAPDLLNNTCVLHNENPCNTEKKNCNTVTNVTNVTENTKNTKRREEEHQPGAENPAPGSSAVISLPTLNGNEFLISQERIDQFAKAYPSINVLQEIERMKAWLISNPKNGKTNILRFVNNWLSKQQDKTGLPSRGLPTDKPSQRTLGNEARWEEYLHGNQPKEQS